MHIDYSSTDLAPIIIRLEQRPSLSKPFRASSRSAFERPTLYRDIYACPDPPLASYAEVRWDAETGSLRNAYRS